MQLLHNLEEKLFVVLVLVLMTMKTQLKSNWQGGVNSESEWFNLNVWQIKGRVTRTIRMTDMNLPVSFLAWKSVCKNNFSITEREIKLFILPSPPPAPHTLSQKNCVHKQFAHACFSPWQGQSRRPRSPHSAKSNSVAMTVFGSTWT